MIQYLTAPAMKVVEVDITVVNQGSTERRGTAWLWDGLEDDNIVDAPMDLEW
jgi:hypothetical protein